MKKVMLMLIIICILGSFAGGCVPVQQNNQETHTDIKKAEHVTGEYLTDYHLSLPEDYVGTLTMWGWDDSYYRAVTEAFKKKYPNVTFEYTNVANGDLVNKYQTALAIGGELPDIAWAIVDSRAQVFALDMWEPLDQEPYNFDISEIFEYLHPQMINEKGEVCGIEQSISPAGLAYRKDLAKKYLGTDNLEELEEMLSDWDDFIEKGREVYQKSDGQVYMFRGLGDVQVFIREQGGEAWIAGNEIRVTDALEYSINRTGEFRDNNIVDNLESWSLSWYQSFGGEQHIFAGYATWSLAMVIEPYDIEGQQKGHWGLMSAPEGNISWGGTTMGITKTCEDKRLAWEFIKFATLSTEGAEAINAIGLMTSAVKPYQENPALGSYESSWFGEQDLGKYFLEEIIPNIKTRPINKDDNVIHEVLNLVSTALNNDPLLSSAEVVELLKKELSERLPDYEVK